MAELTMQQLEGLRMDLIRLKQELQGLLTATSESSRPVSLDQPIGRLSRMDALQQQQMAMASRQALEQRLVQVRNALQAIGNNRFGECRLCEEPIGYARLQARPETPFCLACQEDREGGR